MKIQTFFDEVTFTLTYLVYDEIGKDAILIDPVLDYDPLGSTLEQTSLKKLQDFVEKNQLKLHYIIETHAHADHLTSAQDLKKLYPHAITAIHENIRVVQETFKGVFNLGDEFDTEGKVFDKLLTDGEVITAGDLKIKVLHTPGHTPACISLLVNDEAVFTGDALFMPDFGTGRCDFPAGSAGDLYHSIKDKLYKLPDSTQVYVGHDYQPGGRPLEFISTIGQEKSGNIHIKENTSKEEYVRFRTERDAVLKPPKLLLPSIQVNAQNGKLPAAESNGVSYLKIPIQYKS